MQPWSFFPWIIIPWIIFSGGKFGATVEVLYQNNVMVRVNLPESVTVIHESTTRNTNGHRADQILNALIIQTSQVDYDEITVDQLITEYENLMS